MLNQPAEVADDAVPIEVDAEGWGLSYTSFQHSNLAAELDLENTRILVRTEAGLETIQVYAQCKVSLQPGKTKVVDLVVELRDLAAYDVQAPAEGSWHLEGGVYAIFEFRLTQAGSAASAEFLQRAEVHIAEYALKNHPCFCEVDAVECKGKECAPDPQLIQGASVPSRLPLDPFMLFVFAVISPDDVDDDDGDEYEADDDYDDGDDQSHYDDAGTNAGDAARDVDGGDGGGDADDGDDGHGNSSNRDDGRADIYRRASDVVH
ncbi:Beta-glucosidase B [Symbiodinium microadriaticum]|uniref:Beta-glucosidase B n=1 Tax=Symbiodinium microadriaticum TaxID=2951 RepID=A0A1Q9E712_SYMMI|nr:Beta-glucosidase B [Symbiodinium microadriaticum]